MPTQLKLKTIIQKKITHGEAVLSGMILASKISTYKKICSKKTLDEIKNIYNKYKLDYTYRKYSDKKEINKLLPFLKNDKKNNDKKINFILLRKIGKTTLANQNKLSLKSLKNISRAITQY